MTESIALRVSTDCFATRGVFTIARGSRTQADVITVRLSRSESGGESSGEAVGQGECVPYARYGETMDSVSQQIMVMQPALAAGLDRLTLQELMPPGAARNALDCALWDLQAKASGKPVWELAGLEAPESVITAYTLSLDTPENMQAAAQTHAYRPLLKVKLGGDNDIARLEAVRRGAPESTLIVDANEGWSAKDYDALAPVMLALGVALVEQPLPANDDGLLAGRDRPLPVCADEACHDRASLASLTGKYDVINIKLDKTGGLTEALALRKSAMDSGFQIMVGCMVGSSLAMAPALLVAQGVDYVDLDGPLLLSQDRNTPMRYDGSLLHPASRKLWG
ncbi:dipeptide epimerase [bacterium]|nr:dipeptide epimerase [bacterium]